MEPRSKIHVDPRVEPERSAYTPDDGNLMALLRDLRDETTTLLRQEVALAKAELSEKMSRMAKHTTSMAVGGVMALGAFGLLLLGITRLLAIGLISAGMSEPVTHWLAPLIVAAVVGLIGIAVLMKGKKALTNEGLAPEKTMETLKEDKDWAKNRMNKVTA